MTTYVLPPDTVPYNAQSRECTLPSAGHFSVDITLKAKPKVTRVFNGTRWSGDSVPEHITSIEQLITMSEKYPKCYTDFNTSETLFRKIDCIKAVRSVTGWGLKEAKEFVEEMGRLSATITICDFQRH